ncbi:o-succinylbenzoate synthase [Salinigranum marinum]|uniref:o-succinylbenzoate synthase n=1 Tax=Salinigranum marinum TaxID=1515595 RepID=UPI002989B053|nr:o-succinylbenzoate synthase [Salinigranum marinum]
MTVDVSPFDLPLRTSLSTARGPIDRRRGFVLRGTVDGSEGVGEATPLPGWTESVDDCRRALELVDDPGAALGTGILDDAPAARHAVSLALFDARARAAGESLARFLGGASATVAERVPVNATVGSASVQETADAVRDAAAVGHDCVKMKVGVDAVDRDIERLVAAREAAPRVDLRADANGAWTRGEAERFADAIADHGLSLDYLEQPLSSEALAGHAALRAETDLRIALDETLASVSVDAVLSTGAADVLVLKPMAMGGPDRTLAVAERAAEAGVDSVVTTTIDAVVARTAALHIAATLGDPPACGLATADLLARDLAPDPAPVEAGRMTVPGGPGTAGDAFATLDT